VKDMQRGGKPAAPLSFCLSEKLRRENPLWFLPAPSSRRIPAPARPAARQEDLPPSVSFPSSTSKTLPRYERDRQYRDAIQAGRNSWPRGGTAANTY
jgi:hypothetical protein